jgi:hypothetical protein
MYKYITSYSKIRKSNGKVLKQSVSIYKIVN